MRLDHLLSKEKEQSLSSGTIQLKRKKSREMSFTVELPMVTDISGVDAFRGHTRSHPEHDG